MTIVEAVSKERGGIKIDGKWRNPVENVKNFSREIKKGDDVEYKVDKEDDTKLIYIRKVSNGAETSERQILVAEIGNLAKTQGKMFDALICTEGLLVNEALHAEFKDKLDWTKIAIAIFNKVAYK